MRSSGFFLVGTWLSLVEHSLGVRGVGSSNLPVPTICLSRLAIFPAPNQEKHFDRSRLSRTIQVIALAVVPLSSKFFPGRNCK
jgi:hypothetical protein